MSDIGFRSIIAPVFGAALCLAAMPHTNAARNSAIIEQFVARAISVSDTESAGRVDIYIERWSTDEEAENLRRPLLDKGPEQLLPTLQNLQMKLRRVGVVLMPGVGGGLGARARTRTPKNLLFARAIDTPKGRRVIVATDEHLGLGESPREARKEVEEFNLIDIRFGPDGAGVGKVADATDVAYSPNMKTLELKNYASQPERLVDVRSERP